MEFLWHTAGGYGIRLLQQERGWPTELCRCQVHLLRYLSPVTTLSYPERARWKKDLPVRAWQTCMLSAKSSR